MMVPGKRGKSGMCDPSFSDSLVNEWRILQSFDFPFFCFHSFSNGSCRTLIAGGIHQNSELKTDRNPGKDFIFGVAQKHQPCSAMNVSEHLQHLYLEEHVSQPTKSNPGRSDGKLLAILGLPSEVLQLILYYMDPQTFSISLVACKAFWNAGRSKSVLLRHLSRMPGLRDGLEDLETNDLFLIFRHRAAVGLLSAGLSANVTLHRATKGSSLLRAVTSHICGDYLASIDKCGRILVYHLFQDDVVLNSVLLPNDPRFYLTDHDLKHIAFSTSGDLIALYMQKASVRYHLDSALPSDEADSEDSASIFTLFTFKRKLTALRRSRTTSWSQSMKILECHEADQPVGLAMDSAGTVCIAIKDPAWSVHGGIHLMMYGCDRHNTGRAPSGKSIVWLLAILYC